MILSSLSRRDVIACTLIAVFCGLGCPLSGVRADTATGRDALAPSFRLFAAPGAVRATEATLLWDKPAASSAPLVYRVFRDGTPIGTTNKTHFTDRSLAPAHRYTFAVAVQGSGNGSAPRSNELPIDTPPRETVLSVERFGARGDGTTLNTRAIQAAIDACPPQGVVHIPAGVFVSGALFLKSDMTLEIAAGGVLKGSTSPRDYEPFIANRFEGWELKTYASLLNAGRLDRAGPANVHHLSIRGRGRIAGGGNPLGKAMIAAHGMRSRGRLICLMNCAGVDIQGLTLETPPCWTLHTIYSEDIGIHDLTIETDVPNGDGIDPDSSRNCYIFNCTFSTGDDCIAIKSGKNPEGNLVARPTENVRIFDCRFTRGHGISIGSEMSGGVRGVLVEDCVAVNLLNGFQIKSTKDRGGVVEDVVVRDCDLQKISIFTALEYNNDGAPAPEPPYFRNFRFVRLDLRAAPPHQPVILVNGFAAPGHRTRDLVFEGLRLPAGAIVKVDQAENVTFSHVTTADGRTPTFEVTRSERVMK